MQQSNKQTKTFKEFLNENTKITIDNFGHGKVVPTFEDLMNYLKQKLRLKIVFNNSSDSYFVFKKGKDEFSLSSSWEGGKYTLKLADEEGETIATAPEKFFMEDGWYKIEFIEDFIRSYC